MTVETHPTLYKRTATGAVQVWWMEHSGNEYRTATGQLDGKIHKSDWAIVFGKNIGKKNETTDETQAIAEITAAYKNKMTRGRYTVSVDTIDNKTYVAPMLAHTWEKHEKHHPTEADYENQRVLSQAKLDGIRCIAKADGLWTRTGKPIVAVPHIWESLKPLFAIKPNLVLDGELYTHQYHNRLNKISGLCRKQNPTEEELVETSVIQYHIYDNIPQDELAPLWDIDSDGSYNNQLKVNPDAGFSERHNFLAVSNQFDSFWVVTEYGLCDGTGNIMWHPMDRVIDPTHADTLMTRYLAANYEGQMIRKDGEPYQHKRCHQLMKRKEWQEREFPIVRIEEGSGNRRDMAGTIIYLTDDGNEFGSGIAGGTDWYKQLWVDKDDYIGGQGTVRFFTYTQYGIPYLPVTHNAFKGKRDE